MLDNCVNKEIIDEIGIITINRSRALNSLNRQILCELNEVVESISIMPVRCIIIRGGGTKAFVAGADICEMEALSKSEAFNFSKFGNEVFEKIDNLVIPTIAVIDGYALGGGCELALSCDLRICSEKSVFGQPETGLGIIPGFGGTQRLARIVGVSKAKQMIFTGESIGAQEAYRIGLVNEIYSSDCLFDEAIKLAQKISNNAPMAVQASKKIINQGIQIELCKAIEFEELCFSQLFQTNDQKEGMRAFLEKRAHAKYTNT